MTTFLYLSVFAAYSPNGCMLPPAEKPVRMSHLGRLRWVRSSAELIG